MTTILLSKVGECPGCGEAIEKLTSEYIPRADRDPTLGYGTGMTWRCAHAKACPRQHESNIDLAKEYQDGI